MQFTHIADIGANRKDCGGETLNNNDVPFLTIKEMVYDGINSKDKRSKCRHMHASDYLQLNWINYNINKIKKSLNIGMNGIPANSADRLSIYFDEPHTDNVIISFN